jgi:hypothetical protein
MLWLLLCTGLAFKWPVREYLGPLLAGIGVAFLAGLAGLYARYAGRVGYIGKLGLALAIVGAAPVAIVGALKIVQAGDTGWPGFLLLTSLLFIGLVLFGIDALRVSARLSWGALPIVMGLDGLMIWGIESQTSGAWQLVGLLYLFGIGWMLLGYSTWSDSEQHPSARLSAVG